MMNIRCYEDNEFFKSKTNLDKWNKLLSECSKPSVFQSFEWNKVWWETLGGKYQLRIYTLENENGDFCALAPLCIGVEPNKWLPTNTLRIMGTRDHSSDYGEILFNETYNLNFDEFFDFIFNEFNGFKNVILSHLRDNGPTYSKLMDYISRKNKHHLIEFQTEAPSIDLSSAEENQKLLNKKNIKRKVNYFKNKGTLEFKEIKTFEDAESNFDLFFEQHIQRRKIAGGESIFISDLHRNFYKNIFRELQKTNQVHFSAVIYNNEPIAYHFGFTNSDKFIWYKPSFEVKIMKKSPGEVLIYFLLKNCIEKQIKEFDFTVGMENFKYRFSNKNKKIYRITFYKNFLDCIISKIIKKLKKMIKKITSKQ
jgi:CelD/BcsL family acetyltransferase involved in cellulose biosynthesis